MRWSLALLLLLPIIALVPRSASQAESPAATRITQDAALLALDA